MRVSSRLPHRAGNGARLCPSGMPAHPHAPAIGGRVSAPTGRRVARYRYAFLLLTLFASLAVQGIVAPGSFQQIVVTVLSGAAATLAVLAAGLSQRAMRIATAVAVVVIAASLWRATVGGIGEGAARLMNAALVALGPPAIALGIVRDIRRSGHVRVETVMGVLSFYILIGMLFAFTYGGIDHLGGHPFFANGEDATTSHCLYFSFTTLTTVGYGDFVARSDLGHTLAVFEALIGQIYLVTVVSLIVSNLRRPADR
jgi:Ion channel